MSGRTDASAGRERGAAAALRDLIALLDGGSANETSIAAAFGRYEDALAKEILPVSEEVRTLHALAGDLARRRSGEAAALLGRVRRARGTLRRQRSIGTIGGSCDVSG